MPRIFLDCEAADLEAFALRIQTIRKNERLLSMPAYNLFEQYEKFVLSLAKRAREEDEAQGKKRAVPTTPGPVPADAPSGPATERPTRKRRSVVADSTASAGARLENVDPVRRPAEPEPQPARRPRGRPRKVDVSAVGPELPAPGGVLRGGGHPVTASDTGARAGSVPDDGAASQPTRRRRSKGT